MAESLAYQKTNEVKISYIIEILIYITVFINTYTFFKQPFEGHLYYLIFIGLIPFFIAKYKLSQYVILILSYLAVVGLLHVALDSYEFFDWIKVWGGFLLNLIFFYLVIRYYKFDIERIFSRLIFISFIVSVIGLFQAASYVVGFGPGYDYSWIFNKWGLADGGFIGIRINSVLSEPAYIGATLAPAMYVSLYNLIHRQNKYLKKWQSIIVLICYLLSGSSTAYIGLLLGVFLVTDSIKLRYFAIGSTAMILMGIFLYDNSEDFRYRVDTSLALWLHQEYTLENTNSSSFVLYNNAMVTASAFSEHPVFGTGLGSYGESFEEYTLTKTVLEYDFEFNTADGNSMLLRLLVETGLVGTVAFLILLFKCFIPKKNVAEHEIQHRIISQSIFILIMLFLLRQGNYFLNGMFLFVLLYYYNWKIFSAKNKLAMEQEKSLPQ